MIEQPEILKHDADAAAQVGDLILAELGGFPVEERDQPARRLQRQKDKAHQRRLAGAGGPGQELKRMRLDLEADVLQDFIAHPVTQADVLETNQDKLPRAMAAPNHRL